MPHSSQIILCNYGTNREAYLGLMLVIVLLVEANIWAGTAQTQKPLGSVAGTIHFGLGLTVVLFLVATNML